MSYVEAFANHLSNELDKMEARCAELGEAMRRIGIEQFEANAARIRAEEALVREKYAYEVAQEQRTHFKNRLAKAEQALRAAFEAINDDDISGAYLILRTYLAGISS